MAEMHPVIQHWLVAVARAAGLVVEDGVGVPSDAEPTSAWDLVAMAAGVDEERLARAVAAHYRLEVADLAAADPHAHRLLPARVARALRVVPLRYSDRFLWVATADPVSLEAEREIAAVAGRSVHFEVAPPRRLGEAVDATYPGEEPIHELPPLEAATRGGPRVLVVDDDPDTRLLVGSTLEGAGFRVSEAADGREAVAALDDTGDRFSLVTLDLDMPGMDGLETLRRIRSRMATHDLPVVVATGIDDPEVEMTLFEAGADDFVVKPLDPPRFLVRVRAVLRRRPGGFTALLDRPGL